MLNKLKAWWSSLPHQKQAMIVTVASAAGASLIHAIEDAGIQNCSTWSCAGAILARIFSPHMIATAIFAGGAALKLFYTLPNLSAPPK